MRRPAGFAALAFAAAAAPTPAAAHLVGMEFGDFYAGSLHLVLAPGYVAALAGLALVAAGQARETARWMLAALPAGIGAGILLAYGAGPLAPEALLIGAALAVTGLIGAFALRMPMLALGSLCAAGGAVLGYANGLAAYEGGVDRLLFALGVLSAGTVIGTLTIAVASALTDAHRWAPLGARVASSWIAAIGTIYFAFSLS
ncbi:MAG: HupE/UreJ family protein [Pseudomonadota bacterium]